mgnify:CR=1 FL=1
MKLPIKSINEFTECSLSINEILEVISTKIGEIEGVMDFSKMYEGLVIGQITKKDNHPNADKLGVYMINIGEGKEIQVVAGDKNLEVGNKVAYINPGYIVPYTYGSSQPIKIKSTNMRGIQSNGMLCSQKELNIGSDDTHVFVLEEDAPIGTPFAQYYQLDDVVIEIENKALTNRGDLFGILGLAREISAAQNIPFKSPDWYIKTDSDIDVVETLPIKVDNQAQNLCARYTCISIKDVKVKESPVWMKSILIKSGIKPINNIVDITNYLSIITGQPLHAFDYNKLIENDIVKNGSTHITVRLAKNGERIHTLDGTVVELSEDNLVIADSTNPIAIAGVIGGMDTQVDENTKNIIIESANFNRYSIRKTSMQLGIFTEAVTRFTRGQAPQLCLPILLKAVELTKELSQGQAASNVVDVYPEPLKPKILSLSISKLNTHLGTTLSKEEIKNILSNIEYEIISEDNEYITIQPPVFRTDISIPEDVYEDIGRIYGYENILPKLPLREINAVVLDDKIALKEKIRNILTYSGCNELDTYSFTSKETLLSAKQDPNLAYHIKNALSPELEFMRISILTSLLEKAKENIQRNISPLCIYEFNIPHQKGYMDNFQLPKEEWHLSMVFSSREKILDGSPYYQIKRYAEKIFNSIKVENITYELVALTPELELPLWIKCIIPTFNPNQSAIIKYHRDGVEGIIGIVGDIDYEVKNNFKLPDFTAGMEINLEEVIKQIKPKEITTLGSKFPPIWQDVCFTVPSSTKYSDVENAVLQVINTRDRTATVECIDIYQKSEHSKNITLRITIEHQYKTLSDKEFEKIKTKIEERIKNL